MSTKLWTKDFIMVSTTNFFLYFIHYLLIASMTVFTIEKFHVSTSLSGLAGGIFIIGMLFGRLYGGKSINKVGWKRMLYIGIIFSLLMILCYFTISSISMLLVIRFLHGIGFGIASTATATIVSQIIPDKHRGEGTGYYALSTTLASAIGPFFGIYINHHVNFSANFMICLVLIACSLVCAFLLKVPKVTLPKEIEKGFHLHSFFEFLALPISVVCLFVGIAYSSVISYINSYAQEINLVTVASFFFIVYSAAILITRPFTGKLFDSKGENYIVYPILVAFIIGLILLSQAHNGFVLLISAVFIGIGFGTFLPSAQAIVVKNSPRHRMGLATSTLYMFADFGTGFGPFLLGIFIPFIGYRNLYLVMAVIVVFASILYYFVHGKKTKSLVISK
ncbi:MAG: MFS transporter [Kurthia sp.]|nr:MFS transporter [Candidatus Kurthia equi]